MDPAPTHPACQRGAGSDQWLHEIKFDGYRMHARFDRGAVRLLTRTGLDWTPAIAAAVASLPATQAYLEGELCGVRPDGITSFSMIQTASDSGNAAALVFFSVRSSLFRRGRCQRAAANRVQGAPCRVAGGRRLTPALRDHQIGHGRAFHEKACAMALEGIVSKRADAQYAPGNRGLWVKVKCLHRVEFVVVGWTDPRKAQAVPRRLAACLLRSGRPAGLCRARLHRHQAGGAAAGCGEGCSRSPSQRMPLAVPPSRDSRFGSPLVLSRVHWVRPELVAEVKDLAWTGDYLLRPGGPREPARGQAGRRGAPSCAEPEAV
jgi:ATP-dependent DNA ligase